MTVKSNYRYRRPRRKPRRMAWLPISFLLIGGLAYVSLTFSATWDSGKTPPMLPEMLYFVFLMFAGQELQGIAVQPPLLFRWMELLTIGLTFSALLQVLSRLFTAPLEAIKMRRYKNHIVIFGLSRKGRRLAMALKKAGHRVILFEPDENHPSIDELEQMGVLVRIGDGTRYEELAWARVLCARELVCLADDDSNANIKAALVNFAAKKRKNLPTLIFHFSDTELYDQLKLHERAARKKGVTKHLRFINTATLGAYRLLDWKPPSGCAPQELFSNDPAEANHFIIIGTEELGLRFIVESTRQWTVTDGPDSSKAPTFTLVGADADTKAAILERQYKTLSKIWNINTFNFKSDSEQFELGEFLGHIPPRRIVVVHEDDGNSIKAGLDLIPLLMNREWEGSTYVLVSVDEDEGLVWSDVLQSNDSELYKCIQPFRVISAVYTVDYQQFIPRDQIAVALHEIYLKDQEANNPDLNEEELQAKKPACKPWEILPDNFKESNRMQAASLVRTLSLLKSPCVIEVGISPGFAFSDEEETELAMREHERWVNERRSLGWEYGEVRDDNSTKPKHPNIVPWEDLTKEEQGYDRAFVRKWGEALQGIGLCIKRSK